MELNCHGNAGLKRFPSSSAMAGIQRGDVYKCRYLLDGDNQTLNGGRTKAAVEVHPQERHAFDLKTKHSVPHLSKSLSFLKLKQQGVRPIVEHCREMIFRLFSPTVVRPAGEAAEPSCHSSESEVLHDYMLPWPPREGRGFSSDSWPCKGNGLAEVRARARTKRGMEKRRA